MTLRWLQGILLLSASLLGGGCTLFDSEPTKELALPTPSTVPVPSPPTLTPSPTVDVLQLGERVDLTWSEVELSVMEGEIERPFEKRVEELGGSGKDLWRAYFVEGDASPVLLQESPRWLTSATWIDEGEALYVTYWTAFGTEFDDLVPGTEKLVLGQPTAVWDLLLPGSAYRWPEGGYAILSDRRGGMPVLHTSDGSAWLPKAEGASLELSGVSPDGRFVVLSSKSRSATAPVMQFIAEPLGHEATFVGMAYGVAWSPDLAQVALLDVSHLSVFSTQTGQQVSFPLPNSVPYGTRLEWSRDGAHLLLNDGVLQVASQTWLIEPTNRYVAGAAISPESQLLVVMSDPLSETTDCNELLMNETVLVDLTSGEASVLFDCNRFLTGAEWLDNSHFIAYTHTCWACEGRSQPFLVSVESGSVEPLSPAFSIWASHVISPDGNRVLITGPDLRIYALDGTLLRQIEAEEGYEITRAAWKPDGSGFVYIVGPKDFFIL